MQLKKYALNLKYGNDQKCLISLYGYISKPLSFSFQDYVLEIMYRSMRLRRNITVLGFVMWMIFLSAIWISHDDFRAASLTRSPLQEQVVRPLILENIMKIHGETFANKDLEQTGQESIMSSKKRELWTKPNQGKITAKQELSEPTINLTELQINMNSYIRRYDTGNGNRLARSGLNRRIQSFDSRYYNLSRPKTDHCNFDLLINRSAICADTAPYMVILIPSAPRHIEKRRAIRNTWGRYGKKLHFSSPYEFNSVKLVFLMGKDVNSSDDHVQEYESERFRDIVFGNFRDTYNNLTRKVLLGLKWVTMFCPGAQYILKADDDSFVHIPNLVDMLMKNPADSKGCIYGKLNPRSPVQRIGKWKIPYGTYPMREYPPYVTGGTYVISGNIAWKLLAVSGYMPYLTVEDAFVTGVLRFIIGGYIEAIPDFMNGEVTDPTPCKFMSENRISANIRNVTLMTEMWLAQLQFSNMCRNLTRNLG